MGAKPVSLRIKSASVNGVLEYQGHYVFWPITISGSLCILANYNVRVTIYFGGFLLHYFLSNQCNFDFEVINHVSTIINKQYTH